MNCIYHNCKELSMGLFTWGLYPNGENNKDVPLCKTHSDELWNQAKGLVACGKMFYCIKPVKAKP